MTAHDQVDLLAQIGVTVLLFVVGLKLDMHVVRSVGPVALATGIGQIVFTTVIGFAIAMALGMVPLTAIYVAVALTCWRRPNFEPLCRPNIEPGWEPTLRWSAVDKFRSLAGSATSV